MPLSRRYSPEWAPGEQATIGLDLSFVVPPGVGITTGTLSIWSNSAVPVPKDADFQVGPVTVRGRTIYATLAGGAEGTDYQLRWGAADTDGNWHPRTCLLLCAQTS